MTTDENYIWKFVRNSERKWEEKKFRTYSFQECSDFKWINRQIDRYTERYVDSQDRGTKRQNNRNL